MATVTYKCPNCGGQVNYDAEKRVFVCQACGTQLAESSFVNETDTASEQSSPGGYIYVCPTCGAQLVTDGTTAATRCYYCHSSVVLSGRLTAEYSPNVIIPFTIDKNKALDAFKSWIKGKKYLPRGFFYEGQIENLMGVYFPYWIADYRGNGTFSGEGRVVTRTTTTRYYITKTDIYRVYREGALEYRNVMRSALSKADRQLADGIHPYDLSAIEGFRLPYLAGFYAEKRDVDEGQVSPDIEKEVKSYTMGLLTRGNHYTSVSGDVQTTLTHKRYRYALFPAWVMTYRDTGGKQYYFAMNGQTAKICGRLPVAHGKLFFHALLWFLGVFGALLAGGYFLW